MKDGLADDPADEAEVDVNDSGSATIHFRSSLSNRPTGRSAESRTSIVRVKDRSGALGPEGRGFRRAEVDEMRLSVARKVASRSTRLIL